MIFICNRGFKKQCFNLFLYSTTEVMEEDLQRRNAFGWYVAALTKYVDFTGRARRKEYWSFALINTSILFLLYGLAFATVILEANTFASIAMGAAGLYLLGTMLPGIAAVVRRLHDVGKSGAYFLVYFIPLAGPIWLLVLLCTEGEPVNNRWGEDPKQHINQNFGF